VKLLPYAYCDMCNIEHMSENIMNKSVETTMYTYVTLLSHTT